MLLTKQTQTQLKQIAQSLLRPNQQAVRFGRTDKSNKYQLFRVFPYCNFTNLLNLVLTLTYNNQSQFDQHFPNLNCNIEQLTIHNCGIQNIQVLSRCEFHKLWSLKVTGCSLTSIESLKNIKLVNLLILDLSHNKISDIDSLSILQLPSLESLILTNNLIKNIAAFQSCSLNNLSILRLQNNEIEDISSLANSKLNKLLRLNVSYNSIKNITKINQFSFPKLIELSMQNYCQENIYQLVQSNTTKLLLNLSLLNSLQIIKLNQCCITDLSFLVSSIMKPTQLFLNQNMISNIEPLTRVDLSGLKTMELRSNKLMSIKGIEKCNFHHLSMLKLTNNTNISEVFPLLKKSCTIQRIHLYYVSLIEEVMEKYKTQGVFLNCQYQVIY